MPLSKNVNRLILSIFYLIFILSWHLHATHIVGGEVTLKHLTGNSYKITLNLYFDRINGNPAAEDKFVKVAFYDKASNTLLDSINVPLFIYSDIPTEKGNCNYIQLQTRKITYIKDTVLDPVKYNGSEGFYAAWARCCRNSTIINIMEPSKAATVFYSDFPPIGIINSSPEFASPEKNGFACIGIPFTYDFSATDGDKDSLIYELISPLNGSLTSDEPGNLATPAPYAPVKFQEGISKDTMITGSKPLIINSLTGILSLTADLAGLYVFSVRCSEYRKGIYLGSIRRDFQLSVIRCLGGNNKPILSAINPNTSIIYDQRDTIKIDNKFSTCIDLMAIETVPGQKLSLTAKAINFSSVLTVSPSFNITKLKTDTSKYNACLKSCIKTNEKTLNIQFIVKNENNCALPRFDTVVVTFKNISKLKPTLITTNPYNQQNDLLVNMPLNFNIHAENTDSNTLKLFAKGVGFTMDERNMKFTSVTGIGKLQSQFSFLSNCSDLKGSPYTINFIAKDSSCFGARYDSLKVTITVKDTITNFQLPLLNIITPNGDGINDIFRIDNLPKDNCTEAFSIIEIYNRWGTKVFSEDKRNFQWDATNISDGLYYYIIKYKSQVMKSWLHVMR